MNDYVECTSHLKMKVNMVVCKINTKQEKYHACFVMSLPMALTNIPSSRA